MQGKSDYDTTSHRRSEGQAMSQHTELIARLRKEPEKHMNGRLEALLTEAADALQAMEFALDATATPKSLTTKREKVILLTGAQNENSLLRAQLATQSLRLEDANGLLRYVADQRDAALGKLQAMERVPMTRVERRSAFLALDNPSSYDDFMTGLDTAEAHHGITPPESKG